MASYNPSSERLFVTCPYNPNHKVSERRQYLHIVDCAKVNRHMNLQICPFNFIHRIKQEDYNDHIQTCPDNKRIVRQIAEQSMSESGPLGKYPVARGSKASYDDDDDWDGGSFQFNFPDETTKRVDAVDEKGVLKPLTQAALQRLSPAERRIYNENLKKRVRETEKFVDPTTIGKERVVRPEAEKKFSLGPLGVGRGKRAYDSSL